MSPAGGQKPDTLTHLTADTGGENDPRLAFRAVLDSTIALTVWLQMNWRSPAAVADGYPFAAGQHHARRCAGGTAGGAVDSRIQRGAAASSVHQPLRYLGHDHGAGGRHGRDVALLNLLRGKVREAEVTAAQVFITPQFAVQRADILQALNRLSSAVYVMMITGVTDAPPALSQLQQLGGEDDH